MKTSNPLLSVIIPSFNQGRYIQQTIQSVLDQDYRPIELLIMDGGSTDETADILHSFSNAPELWWESNPDRGVVDAVNKGLQKASGDILAIQSSDDVYLPGAFSTAVDFFNDHPEAALVYGDVEYIDADSQITGRTNLPPFQLCDYVGKLSYIPQASAFFRRSAADRTGKWREDISYAADAEYWLRIALLHTVAKIDRLLARYRYHPDQRDCQGLRVAADWDKAVHGLIREHPVSRSTRRFARMGIHLTYHHYLQESLWLRRTRHLYSAAAANPRAVFDSRFPKRELLFGREPVWKFLSRVKRQLGLEPRT